MVNPRDLAGNAGEEECSHNKQDFARIKDCCSCLMVRLYSFCCLYSVVLFKDRYRFCLLLFFALSTCMFSGNPLPLLQIKDMTCMDISTPTHPPLSPSAPLGSVSCLRLSQNIFTNFHFSLRCLDFPRFWVVNGPKLWVYPKM